MTHRKRRPRPGPRRRRKDMDNPIIGYVARAGMMMVCTGDACIVTGSRANMQRWLARYYPGDAGHVTIEPTCLEHLLFALRHGGAYDLDQAAYERFRPHALRHGMPLPRQAFRADGRVSNELVRVQWGLLPDVPRAGSMACGSGRAAASPRNP